MIEKIHQKLSDSKVARWSVLALAAFTMLCGYFLTDVMAPVSYTHLTLPTRWSV